VSIKERPSFLFGPHPNSIASHMELGAPCYIFNCCTENAWSYTSTPLIRLHGVVLIWSTATFHLSPPLRHCLHHALPPTGRPVYRRRQIILKTKAPLVGQLYVQSVSFTIILPQICLYAYMSVSQCSIWSPVTQWLSLQISHLTESLCNYCICPSLCPLPRKQQLTTDHI